MLIQKFHLNRRYYRTSKTFKNGIGTILQEIEYTLSGDKVLYETDGTYGIAYTYDYDGTLIHFNYDYDIYNSTVGTDYFYLRNQQGDITTIIDNGGNVTAKYRYDAYGNITDIVDNSAGDIISKMNPYSYRGYRYDSEIGYYYLNSRYYNPGIGRFINADGMLGEAGDILSTNMYAYCANNPVMNVDPSGSEWYHWLIATVIVVGLAAALVITAGGATPAIAALMLAANGLSSGTMALTILGFSAVGASLAYGGSALDSAKNSNNMEEFMDCGESAMWLTAGSAVISGLGGYLSYKQQKTGIGHSFSTEAKNYWKGQGNLDGKATTGSDGYSTVLHHPFGRYGSKMGLYYPITRTDHIQIHSEYGNGRGFGGYNQYYPFDNWWTVIRKIYGAE